MYVECYVSILTAQSPLFPVLLTCLYYQVNMYSESGISTCTS